MKKTALFLWAVLLTLNLNTWAENVSEQTAVGLWRTIDDKTGKPRSLIRIHKNGGEAGDEYSAVVEKGLLDTDTGDRVCSQCTDERKGQKVIGMTIAKGLTQNGNKYDGGEILDPENGKIYKCKMTLDETGQKLEVRGYIGFSLLGRSQIWQRVE